MRKALIILISLLTLFSCSRESFSIDSESLGRVCDITIDSSSEVISYKEALYLNAIFSNDSLKYSFLLKDPKKDLSWEGDIASENKIELAITPGASFSSGEWNVIYYADNGTELESSIKLSGVDSDFPYITEDGILRAEYEVMIRAYDSACKEIDIITNLTDGYKIPDDVKSVKIEYVDRYLNDISIFQSL